MADIDITIETQDRKINIARSTYDKVRKEDRIREFEAHLDEMVTELKDWMRANA